MATVGDSPDRLSTRQRRAIAALLSEPDAKAAAKVSKVGYRTLIRWLADNPDFRQALTQAESELIGEAGRRLLSGQRLALDTLEGLITDALRDGDRRQAAIAWLEFTLRFREIRNLEERLTELERLVLHDGKAS